MRDLDMLSRVADNLYWMSRYLERAENTARVIDVYLNLIPDLPSGIQRRNQLAMLLRSLELDASNPPDDFKQLIHALTFDDTHAGSIITHITEARENARQVREQISSEMWLHINRLYLDIKSAASNVAWWDDPHEFYMEVKLGIHLFQGIADSTMLHNQGWRFIQIGRYLERIVNLVTSLRVFMEQPRHSDLSQADYFTMLALLKSVTAFEAYCKVYNPDLVANSILEFLLYNSEFPHSAHFCVNEVLSSIDALSDATMTHKNTRLQRLAGRLQSNLSYVDIEEALSNNFIDYLAQIRAQAFSLHDALYNTYISYPIESALR